MLTLCLPITTLILSALLNPSPSVLPSNGTITGTKLTFEFVGVCEDNS